MQGRHRLSLLYDDRVQETTISPGENWNVDLSDDLLFSLRSAFEQDNVKLNYVNVKSSNEQLYESRNAKCRSEFENNSKLDPETNPTIFIGFSGGLDSLALLVALVRVVGDRIVRCLRRPWAYSHSADWAAHCEKICKSFPCS